jgi:glycosyltransferase involved in cell wall biosynthesis
MLTNLHEEDGVFSGFIGDIQVFLLRNEKGTGPAAARNKLIQFCQNKAQIFAMCDADDELMKEKITWCVDEILEAPHIIGLVYTDHIIHNDEKDTYTYEAREPYDRLRLERENIISNAPVINGVALTAVGLYDENLRTCEDWDLYLRITERFHAVHLATPMQIYRVTGENATFTVDQKLWQQNWQMVQAKLRQRNATQK